MSEESKTRTIVNEVILVGKLRNPADKTIIGNDLADEEKITAVLKKFQFTLTTDPSEAAKNAGVNAGKYFQIRTVDPGGEYIVLPNGKRVKRSRKTGRYGWSNIFESGRKVTYDEIKEELLAKRVDIVAGDPNNGTIRLPEYGLIGFWDEFPAGFFYKVMTINKATGKREVMMSNIKNDDGTFSKKEAVSNIIRHFVYEDEEQNIEAIRDNLRKQVEKYKVIQTDNTMDVERATPVTEKAEPTKPQATTTEKKAEIPVDEEP